MPDLVIDPKIKFIFSDFMHTVAESGLQNTTKQFNDALIEFPSYLDHPILNIDICFLSSPSAQFLDQATNWIIGNTIAYNNERYNSKFVHFGIPINLDIHSLERISNLGLGTLSPTVCFLLVNGLDTNNESLNDQILTLATQNTFLVIISEQEFDLNNALQKEIEHHCAIFSLFNIRNLPKKKFLEKMEEKEFFNAINSIINFNYANTIDSLNSIFGLMIEQEDRNNRSKKSINQQQINKNQNKNETNIHDLTLTIKNELSGHFNLLEKGIADNLENYLRPQTGQYSKLIDDLLVSMPELEEVEKSSSIKLNISADYIKYFFDHIFDSMLAKGQENLVIIRDSFKTTIQDLDKIIEKNQFPHLPFNFRPLTDQQLNLILSSALRYDKPFEGALPKQGIMEYINEFRKYQSIFFGLIAAFGFSFVENLKMIMIPITIILLGVCIYFFYKSIQQEKKESHEREFDKAKDSLLNESKRIASEVSKQWMKAVSDHLQMQLNQNLTIIENSLKDFNTKKQKEEEEERKRIQRQVQGLDNNEKKLTTVAKHRETFIKNLEQLKLEAKRNIPVISLTIN